MTWAYSFPAIAGPPDLADQIQHVRSEVNEACAAYYWGEGEERLAEELMDVIHAAETALRMLDVDMGEVKRDVIEKNYARGYYETPGQAVEDGR